MSVPFYRAMGTGTRILFVDDDAAVLDGLRNVFRRERRRWDMVFAVGGRAAIEAIEAAPFDVVISDMQMPEVDGVKVLEAVREKSPSAARIVLTGHAGAAMIARALSVAHQFLSKPCDAQDLKVAIERTFELSAMVQNAEVRRIVGRVSSLLTASTTYSELTRLAGQPDVDLQKIVAVVERDAGVAAKVLQLVNSAQFGRREPITTIRRAVMYLGIDLIRSLAIGTHVFECSERASPRHAQLLSMIHEDGLRVARAAKACLDDPVRREEAFTAGLLHDVGRLVLIASASDDTDRILESSLSRRVPLHVVEREALGVTHGEVGAYLLGLWGLPFSILETVACHHEPGRLPHGPKEVLAVVHVADALTHTDAAGAIDAGFLEREGLAQRLPEWVRRVSGALA